MRTAFNQNHSLVLSRLKLFFALSRTPHGLLDMATPALAALLWLGAFPSPTVIVLGLITAFAGYTCVYALNDVIDFRVDKEKLQHISFDTPGDCLDDLLVRHPMAIGSMDFKEGVLWVSVWAIVAVVGAYLLNPVCVLIFMGGCALETIYCLLFKITYFRTLISGTVKTTGAVAAIFAVDPAPAYWSLTVLFLWLFFWEIGGQNIPLDWIDLEGDKHFKVNTIPIRFGPERTGAFILWANIISVFLNVFLFGWVLKTLEWPVIMASFFVGLYLLVFPAFQLYRKKGRSYATRLFNNASFYPLLLLIITVIWIVL